MDSGGVHDDGRRAERHHDELRGDGSALAVAVAPRRLVACQLHFDCCAYPELSGPWGDFCVGVARDFCNADCCR